jgi:hypothetical protein
MASDSSYESDENAVFRAPSESSSDSGDAISPVIYEQMSSTLLNLRKLLEKAPEAVGVEDMLAFPRTALTEQDQKLLKSTETLADPSKRTFLVPIPPKYKCRFWERGRCNMQALGESDDGSSNSRGAMQPSRRHCRFIHLHFVEELEERRKWQPERGEDISLADICRKWLYAKCSYSAGQEMWGQGEVTDSLCDGYHTFYRIQHYREDKKPSRFVKV